MSYREERRFHFSAKYFVHSSYQNPLDVSVFYNLDSKLTNSTRHDLLPRRGGDLPDLTRQIYRRNSRERIPHLRDTSRIRQAGVGTAKER
jgi:hypothetical protein